MKSAMGEAMPKAGYRQPPNEQRCCDRENADCKRRHAEKVNIFESVYDAGPDDYNSGTSLHHATSPSARHR